MYDYLVDHLKGGPRNQATNDFLTPEVIGPTVNDWESRYVTLKLPKKSIVIFPSNKWHRVRPVTSGVRKSLVTWFRGPPFR